MTTMKASLVQAVVSFVLVVLTLVVVSPHVAGAGSPPSQYDRDLLRAVQSIASELHQMNQNRPACTPCPCDGRR